MRDSEVSRINLVKLKLLLKMILFKNTSMVVNFSCPKKSLYPLNATDATINIFFEKLDFILITYSKQ